VAVRIRLTRVGATKRPAYRVIAIDGRRPRDGRALEILGFYDPLTTFLDKIVEEGFLRADTRAMLFSEDDGERLLAALREAPTRERYSLLDREEL